MKLVTFSRNERASVGVLIDGDRVLDVAAGVAEGKRDHSVLDATSMA